MPNLVATSFARAAVDVANRVDRVKRAELAISLDMLDADARADDADFKRRAHAARSCGRLPAIRFAFACAVSASSVA